MTNFSNTNKISYEVFRIFLVIAGAILMAININTFVHMVGLLPGGFTGVVLLVQEIFRKFLGVEIPFSIFYFSLNFIPAAICFKYVGKKFTIYSCIMVVLSGLLTDFIPGLDVTSDVLLCSVFGGIINAVSICLCLFAGATSGGTDFIAIFFAEKNGRSAWNYIFAGNCLVLVVAGILFGWDRALYSIIFQFVSTQILNMLYKRYEKTTLLIITDKTNEIYELIKNLTNHDATLFIGKGCYKGAERKMLYTVVSSEEASKLTRLIRKIDSNAFINILQTKELFGKFFTRPND